MKLLLSFLETEVVQLIVDIPLEEVSLFVTTCLDSVQHW